MEEIWRDIEGYEGLYQVSNLGRVKSFDREYEAWHSRGKKIVTHHIKGKITKGSLTDKGYYKVSLTKEGVSISFFVHRLVAEAWIPNQKNKPFVDHINTIRTDNRVENLRWCNSKENANNELTLKKHMNKSIKNYRCQFNRL